MISFCIQKWHCEGEKNMAGLVLAVLSTGCLFTPMAMIAYEGADAGARSFMASHMPVLLAGPKIDDKSLSWIEYLAIKAIAQLTTAKAVVALYNEGPQAMIAIAYGYFFSFDPFIVVALVASATKAFFLAQPRIAEHDNAQPCQRIKK